MTADTNKLEIIKQMIVSSQENLKTAGDLLKEVLGEDIASLNGSPLAKKSVNGYMSPYGGKVVEGVFDGESMIGPDGKRYPVPPNYASKSKLVGGDVLKLTITDNGSFIFKQIGPVERFQTVGLLKQFGTDYRVKAKEGEFKVLTASVTYFKAQPGDQVTILIGAGSK